MIKRLFKNVPTANANGRKVLIIGGTHGNESSAVMAVSMLLNDKAVWLNEAARSFSSVDFYIGWNEGGLEYNTRDFLEIKNGTTDDPNRAFPTAPDTPNRVELTTELRQLIASHDIIIDVHNSPHCLNNVLVNNDLYGASYINWCKNNDVFAVVRESSCDTIKKFAYENGKVAFTVEVDCMGLTQYNEKNLVSNEFFLTHLLKALAGNPLVPAKAQTAMPITVCALELGVHSFGLLNFAKEIPLVYYNKGELIAQVVDYEFNLLEEMYAPVDGYLCALNESLIATPTNGLGNFQPKL